MSANYCINALLEKGLIKVQNFRSNKRKMADTYLITPAGIAQKTILTRLFLTRKMQEYDLLKAEIEVLKREVAE